MGQGTVSLWILKWWKWNLVFCPSESRVHPPAQRNSLRALRISSSHDVKWVYEDGQACCDGGSQACHLLSAGSHGRPDCGSQLFSDTVQSTSLPPVSKPALLDASWQTIPLERDACLGVYHMSPTYQRFTAEDDRGGESRVALAKKKERIDGRERWLDVVFV